MYNLHKSICTRSIPTLFLSFQPYTSTFSFVCVLVLRGAPQLSTLTAGVVVFQLLVCQFITSSAIKTIASGFHNNLILYIWLPYVYSHVYELIPYNSENFQSANFHVVNAVPPTKFIPTHAHSNSYNEHPCPHEIIFYPTAKFSKYLITNIQIIYLIYTHKIFYSSHEVDIW